jgi:FixJ family two-component response regulator
MSLDRVVAVVDDDSSLRNALESLLRSVGFATRIYASAEEFLADTAVRAACVVSDVRMPGISGVELACRLSARRPSIPIILMTAHADAILDANVAACGALTVLLKPFTAQALLTQLEGIIAGR